MKRILVTTIIAAVCICGCGKDDKSLEVSNNIQVASAEIEVEETKENIDEPVDKVVVEDDTAEEEIDLVDGSEKKEDNTEMADEEGLVITDFKVTDISSDNGYDAVYSYEYSVNGNKVEASISDYYFPSEGLDLEQCVGTRLFDVDGDGIEELLFNVYYIGNTISEFAGNIHVVKITEDGPKEILNQADSSWVTPDGLSVSGLAIGDDKLYLMTAGKEFDEDGPIFMEYTYTMEYADDEWIVEKSEDDIPTDSDCF